MRLRSPRHLRAAAHAELISLVVLLSNLFTVHLRPISSLTGPTHGCAYLCVVVATWRLGTATTAAKILAVVPGAGGLLALRRIDRLESARQAAGKAAPS
ncbi:MULTISPECIES: hypothetical protein [unclassified Streptomyces]|uniref:hypothetical protein n=1 Tax=unclassified Streptomyces TaxID=2593676 RepID=UPI0005BB164D|nr:MULTISPECIES: hypothetical protein [unclassified Streptomyces]MYS43126.1 DUF3817 domain-containing protein [Streptomyces sp. SID5998]NED33793.1 DUF3817 domain-containing protein [Streptomyces sp. SID8499]